MNLNWTPDTATGTSDLYIGKLYVGTINNVIPAYDWKTALLPRATGDDSQARMKAAQLAHYYANEAAPWRVWAMTEPDGEEFGLFTTSELARAALQEWVREQIFSATRGDEEAARSPQQGIEAE